MNRCVIFFFTNHITCQILNRVYQLMCIFCVQVFACQMSQNFVKNTHCPSPCWWQYYTTPYRDKQWLYCEDQVHFTLKNNLKDFQYIPNITVVESKYQRRTITRAPEGPKYFKTGTIPTLKIGCQYWCGSH